MKEFFKTKFNVEQTVWKRLLGSIIFAIGITFLIYLCLTTFNDFFLDLFKATNTKEIARNMSLTLLPALIIICLMLELGRIIIVFPQDMPQK